MHTHLDVGGHRVDQCGQARDQTVERVAGPPRLHDRSVARGALDDAHLARDVPLHREVLVRDGLEDLVELAQDRGGVDGLDRGAVIAVEEGGDHGERRRQRHLEPHAGGHRALGPQPLEHRIRLDRGGGVPQRRHLDARGIHSLGDAQAAGVDAGGERDWFVACALDALGLTDHVGLEHDPVEPLADLAVRNATEPGAEQFRSGADRGLGIVVIHAAHEEGTLRLSHAPQDIDAPVGPFPRRDPHAAMGIRVRMA